MADREHVRRIAGRAWFVRDKAFVWERPLRPSDLRVLGESALGVATTGGGRIAAIVADVYEKLQKL